MLDIRISKIKLESGCYSMSKEAEKGSTKLNKKPNSIFTLVKFMKKDGEDIEGGRCMRGKDRRLGFSDKDRKRIWKNH